MSTISQNKNRPAFPISVSEVDIGVEYGLTKREYMAGMIIQGLCAGMSEFESPVANVNYAIELADCLLESLNKESE